VPALATELRNQLERVVVAARDAAEAGARAALEAVAVHHHEPYPHMKPAQRELRNHLRARARQLGDRKQPKPDSSGKDHEIDHLTGECAYEHWHRMLFARFLAENGLLIEPRESMAISLAEAEELAKEDRVDVWVFASRCAQRMLPQIFRPDDPLLQVSFATEHMLKLEKLLASLPQAVFTASDSLGWVYQFWQSKKKDEVNRSEVKIGADEISAVTQLFTEPYMVEFLLHNTLGAWWAGKRLAAQDAASAKTEEELRRKLALPGVGWEYLRFVRGTDGKGGPWRPAAGTFDGWPKTAAEFKVLDPCCGSGHFLVAALHHLVPIRMAEEGLSAPEAVDAVLRDNLHGLEIDERCCQIAAFALAFAAWTYLDAGGYLPLPDLHIACTGIGPQATQEQWLKLAEQSGMPTRADQRERVKNGLLNLHRLFSQAPTLGSLITPTELPADLMTADYETIQPYLAAALAAETHDYDTHERAVAAAGMVKAADLLSGEYTLVITNVPYLGRIKQDESLRSYCDDKHRHARLDLATCFVQRSLNLCAPHRTVAVVVMQNCLFLATYKKFRHDLLASATWNIAAKLGPKGFQTPMWDFGVALLGLTHERPHEGTAFSGIELVNVNSPGKKAAALQSTGIGVVSQKDQLRNPDASLIFEAPSHLKPLSVYAESYQGASTVEIERFRVYFWEVTVNSDWNLHQSTPKGGDLYSGLEFVSIHRRPGGAFHEAAAALKAEGRLGGAFSGQPVWGKNGIACSWMGTLPTAIYLGAVYDNSIAAIVPQNESHLLPIWCFCSSPQFLAEVRKINQKTQVANATLVKVPFDLVHWQKVAAQKYPDGLPEPESDDPTQWLFHGRPEESTGPLQVAVARLLGYRWPAELDDKMRLSKRARAQVKRCDELAKLADSDGIVCIPSVRGEESAAQRLEALLSAAGVKPAKVRERAGGTDLDDWLRNSFFEEHCKQFHDRPFVWHIWDGRKRDGFHVLVNYHKLCEGKGKGRKLLESLTYSYLGEWMTRQKDGVKRGEGGAEDRLAAALELQKHLEAILEGEPPFDLFVRWKPLAEQPIGWEPDINDGVRVNIRPFLASDLPAGRTGAGVLRGKPNIKWTKDRGKEPQRPKAEYPWFWNWDERTEDFMGGKIFDGNRWNDCHYSNKAKNTARIARRGKL
jgi:hypothetical protein